jgi:sugar (pentulose or hexulose) kinase
MKQQELLIGFDLGTSAIKAILTDTTGRIISRASRQVTFIRPGPRHCEIDPDAYVRDVIDILRELAGIPEDPGAIRAMSFCAASGNTLLLDENYKPLINTISWLDQRSAGRAAELWPDIDGDEIYRRAGWPWIGGFPLAHLAWIKDFKPEVWSRAKYYVMNNDYLYYRLCGQLVVDPSKATTFYLRDQERGVWNQNLLDFLQIEESSLPLVLPSGHMAGSLRPDICKATGLSPETVVATGSFDHPSAARSTGVFEAGELLISAGTSWVTFTPIEKRQTGLDNRMLVDPFMAPEGCWGGMLALTAVAERIDSLLRIRFGNTADLYRRFDELASQSAPGAHGCRIDPLNQDGAGIAAQTNEASNSDYCRAIMEGCVFLLVNKLRAVERALGSSLKRAVMVGGPTKSPVWPGILAAAIGAPLSIPESNAHAGALGAAIMAGTATGIFENVYEGRQRMDSDISIIEPAVEATDAYAALYRDFAAEFNLEN